MSVEFIDIPPPEFVGDDESARDLLRLSLRKIEEDPEDFVGFDTETKGLKMPIKKKPLDPINDTVTYWSLSFKVGEIYRRWCIAQQYFLYFSPLLESPKLNIAGWNIKYDAHISWNCGINIWNARRPVDGLVLAILLDENRRSHGLKSCAADFCGLKMTPYTSLFDGILDASGKKAREYETSLIELVELGHEDLVSNYASYDAYAHLRTVEFLIERLEATPIGTDGNLWEHFLSMEMDFTELLWRMERRGMYVDTEYLHSRLPIIEERLKKLEREICRTAGYPININSPKQLQRFFFTKEDKHCLGLAPVKMTATQQASTDEEVMNHLVEAGVEVAKLVVDCRKLYKVKSTYIDALIAMAEHFEDGRIHPNFNQMGARTGRLSTENPNCVDGETEVLTKSGWVRFDELQTWDDAPNMVASLVAQWEPETGNIQFVQADLIKQRYRGKMIHVKNQHIDLLMTPNHRCPLVNRKTGEMKVHEARDYKEDKKQLHAGTWFRRPADAPLNSLSYSRISFLLAVQADGHWHDGGIDFKFNKERKAERLLTILENIGADFSYKEGGSAKYRFRVKAGELVKWAKNILGEDKIFYDWITMLYGDQLSFFCDEIFFWDGCWKRKSMYASKHKRNADWVQLALTLCGKRAKVRKYRTPEGKADSWQVDVTNRDYSLTTNVEKTERPWNGSVYCVRVPSGFFIVRRNGKACITGNSQNMPRPGQDEWGIRRAFTAPPGKKLIVADYCLAGGTLIDTPKGAVPIEEIKVGDLVYGYDQKKGKPNVVKVKRKKYTGRRKTYKVILDNDKWVRTTPDHKWIDLKGNPILAEDLEPGTRLLPLRRGVASYDRRPTLYSHSNRRYVYEHKAVAAAVFGNLPEGTHVHHIDEDINNNDPENLQLVRMSDHLSYHSHKTATRQWATPEIRRKMSKGISDSVKLRGGHRGSNNPNYENFSGEQLICAYCGKTFYQPPCRKAKFCSRECYFDSKNHKVKSVIRDNEILPTYDLEVEGDHIFALEAGVFVHNCQIEMRIMADFSGDKTMIGAIMEGKDLHSFTVALTTPGVRYEEVVAAKKAGKDADDRQQWLQRQRQAKKAVGFGIIYGAGPPKISTEIDISEEDWHAKIDEMTQKTFERRVTRLMKNNPLLTEDQAIEQVGRHSVAGDKIAEYFEAFPGVKGFMDQTPVICRHRMHFDEENNPREWEFYPRTPGAKPTTWSGHSKPFGYVQTLCGRYRRLEDIDHKNYFYRSEAERMSVNTRIQGTAADIAKAAMLRIEHHPELHMMGVLILNQVHDEIVMEVPEENAEAAAPIVKHCMEHPFGDGPENDALRVPIPVDLKIVDRWSEAK